MTSMSKLEIFQRIGDLALQRREIDDLMADLELFDPTSITLTLPELGERCVPASCINSVADAIYNDLDSLCGKVIAELDALEVAPKD